MFCFINLGVSRQMYSVCEKSLGCAPVMYVHFSISVKDFKERKATET